MVCCTDVLFVDAEDEESFQSPTDPLLSGKAALLAPQLHAHTVCLINIHDHHHFCFNFRFTAKFAFIQCLHAS